MATPSSENAPGVSARILVVPSLEPKKICATPVERSTSAQQFAAIFQGVHLRERSGDWKTATSGSCNPSLYSSARISLGCVAVPIGTPTRILLCCVSTTTHKFCAACQLIASQVG